MLFNMVVERSYTIFKMNNPEGFSNCDFTVGRQLDNLPIMNYL